MLDQFALVRRALEEDAYIQNKHTKESIPVSWEKSSRVMGGTSKVWVQHLMLIVRSSTEYPTHKTAKTKILVHYLENFLLPLFNFSSKRANIRSTTSRRNPISNLFEVHYFCGSGFTFRQRGYCYWSHASGITWLGLYKRRLTVQNEYTGLESRNYVSPSLPQSSFKLSMELGATKKVSMSKRHSVWHLLPSYDLENLRGILLGPKDITTPTSPASMLLSTPTVQ